MTKRCVLGLMVVALLLPVPIVATDGQQLSVPTPKTLSISATADNPKLSTLLHTRDDGSFEAKGQIASANLSGDRFIVEMVGGSFTWSLAGRPSSTSAFKTLKLTFEYPRGNMIGFQASY